TNMYMSERERIVINTLVKLPTAIAELINEYSRTNWRPTWTRVMDELTDSVKCRGLRLYYCGGRGKYSQESLCDYCWNRLLYCNPHLKSNKPFAEERVRY